jgi:hypothetical protein
VTTAAGRLDAQPLPGAHDGPSLGRQLLAVEQVPAREARLTSRRTARRVPAALGQE